MSSVKSKKSFGTFANLMESFDDQLSSGEARDVKPIDKNVKLETEATSQAEILQVAEKTPSSQSEEERLKNWCIDNVVTSHSARTPNEHKLRKALDVLFDSKQTDRVFISFKEFAQIIGMNRNEAYQLAGKLRAKGDISTIPHGKAGTEIVRLVKRLSD